MMPIHAPQEPGVGFFWEICFFMLKLCTNNINYNKMFSVKVGDSGDLLTYFSLLKGKN
jgi:hypothetical protein